ncbi:MAG: hypothetical protein ACTSRG_22530 [Candidatus Helarchaeota archaeon]
MIEKNESNIQENNNKTDTRFTTHDITRIAVLIAIMFVKDFIWMIGAFTIVYFRIFVLEWIASLLDVMILIVAALIIGKRFTVSIMMIIYGVLTALFFVFMGGSFLLIIVYVFGGFSLEAVLFFSKPYGDNTRIDVVGGILYGFTLRSTWYIVLTFIIGQYFELWFIYVSIINFTIGAAIGGYLGYRFGKKIEHVTESI